MHSVLPLEYQCLIRLFSSLIRCGSFDCFPSSYLNSHAIRCDLTCELATSKLVPVEESFALLDDDVWNLQRARIECHYEINGGSMKEGQSLMPEDTEKISGNPCCIVQGRYDLMCPMKTAWESHQVLLGSRLCVMPDDERSAKVGCLLVCVGVRGIELIIV